MDINQELKKRAKDHRLEMLQLKFFELEMDRVALIANGDTEGAGAISKRMEAVEKAYNAVEAIPTD